MNNPKIKFTIKNFGEITAELYPEKAPATVENFLSLVESGFFTGLIFHRVINGFMIQGGGFDEAFEQKEAKSIKGEFMANGFMQNDLRHTRGVLSMARTMAPNSASSPVPHARSVHASIAKRAVNVAHVGMLSMCSPAESRLAHSVMPGWRTAWRELAACSSRFGRRPGDMWPWRDVRLDRYVETGRTDWSVPRCGGVSWC
jgi:peptidyl-prolyl cis-trans isomerase B (cyclophilin B)